MSEPMDLAWRLLKDDELPKFCQSCEGAGCKGCDNTGLDVSERYHQEHEPMSVDDMESYYDESHLGHIGTFEANPVEIFQDIMEDTPEGRRKQTNIMGATYRGEPTFNMMPLAGAGRAMVNPHAEIFRRSEPMGLAWRLLKRQTELGEFHPDLPSSYGPVKYYHGTPETNVQQIMRQGLRANRNPYKNIEEYFQAMEDGSHDKLMENYNPTYRGAFVTTKPERALFYGDHDARYPSALIGIREGAGMPEEYIGYGDDTGEDTKRLFPDDYRFMDDVDPKFLTQIKEAM